MMLLLVTVIPHSPRSSPNPMPSVSASESPTKRACSGWAASTPEGPTKWVGGRLPIGRVASPGVTVAARTAATVEPDGRCRQAGPDQGHSAARSRPAPRADGLFDEAVGQGGDAEGRARPALRGARRPSARSGPRRGRGTGASGRGTARRRSDPCSAGGESRVPWSARRVAVRRSRRSPPPCRERRGGSHLRTAEAPLPCTAWRAQRRAHAPIRPSTAMERSRVGYHHPGGLGSAPGEGSDEPGRVVRSVRGTTTASRAPTMIAWARVSVP